MNISMRIDFARCIRTSVDLNKSFFNIIKVKYKETRRGSVEKNIFFCRERKTNIVKEIFILNARATRLDLVFMTKM